MWYKRKVNIIQTYKKSCPSVLKGCWNEERGFCFEILVLKSTCVRILVLVAGGTDITTDVRVLKSASPFWWSLLSSYSLVVHFLYLAHKAAVCACMCRCGHPDMYGLSFVLSGSYRSQKAAQKQLWAITDRSERSGKDGCRGFWEGSDLTAAELGNIFVCEQQNEVNPIIWWRVLYIYLYTHKDMLSWNEWKELLHINTWILWDDPE